MPFLTDYKCRKCMHIWESLLDSREDDDEKCPECNSKDIGRLLGATITKMYEGDQYTDMLKKRSADHSLSLIKKKASYKGTLPPDLGRKER